MHDFGKMHIIVKRPTILKYYQQTKRKNEVSYSLVRSNKFVTARGNGPTIDTAETSLQVKNNKIIRTQDQRQKSILKNKFIISV